MGYLKTFFTISHDLFCIIKTDGYFKKVNPAFTTLLGYSEKELLSKPFTHYIHPEDIEATQKEYAAVSNGKINSVIVNRFHKKNGGYCWLSWYSIVSDTKDFTYAVSRNITECINLKEQLKHEKEEHQKEIYSAVIKAQEKQRVSISEELHDNVNQMLITVKLYNELCLSGNGDKKELLKKSITYLKASISEIQNLCKQLSAHSVGVLEIKDSVLELVHSIMATQQVNVSLDTTALDELRLSKELHLTIYRLLQEILTNVLKHSRARNVAIGFTNDAKGLTIIVTDDGKGFDSKQKAQGSGIKNMLMRTKNQSGTLKLITSPGHGCTYIINFPSLQVS